MDQEGNKSFLRWLFAQRKLWQLAALIAIDVGVVIAEGFLGRLL